MKRLTVSLRSAFLAYGLLAAVGLAVAVLIYWSYQSTTVLEVKNHPVPSFPPEVQAGQAVIFLEVDFCKNYPTHGEVEVSLIGEKTGSKIAVAWPRDETKKVCAKYDNLPIRIPPQTPTDTYVVDFQVTYENINPIKKGEPVQFQSKPFRVVNRALQPGTAQPAP